MIITLDDTAARSLESRIFSSRPVELSLVKYVITEKSIGAESYACGVRMVHQYENFLAVHENRCQLIFRY